MYMVGNQIGPCQVLKSPIFRSTPETPQGQADMEVDGDTPAKRVCDRRAGEVVRRHCLSAAIFEGKADVETKEIWTFQGKFGDRH